MNRTDTQHRHRYIVAYDIADDKRLRRVHKITKAFGWPMQYSVFIADLDTIELIELKTLLSTVINHRADTIAIINVGRPGDRTRNCFQFLGIHPQLPTTGPTII